MTSTELLTAPDQLLEELDTTGYALLSCEPEASAIVDAARHVGQLISARHMGVTLLKGSGSDEWLQTHTESITFPEARLLRYFSLGCLVAAEHRGATTIYDARAAATAIAHDLPEIADVNVRYFSTVYAGQEAVHPLVAATDDGNVLRYRSRVHTNEIVDGLPDGMSEAEFYEIVDGVVQDALLFEQAAAPGDMIVVNNLLTLHSRQPYAGERQMLRIRYDDPHHQSYPIARSMA